MPLRRAFTLIELLVVVAIIALLVAILLPALASARKAGRHVICQSNLHQLGVAYRSYGSDFKQYIATFTGFAGGDNSITNSPIFYYREQALKIVQQYGVANPSLGLFQPQFPHYDPTIFEQHSHLTLADYMGGKLPMSAAACPEDTPRLYWRRDPLVFTSISAAFRPTKSSNKQNAHWFPYSSSYQLLPAAWDDASSSIITEPLTAPLQADYHDFYEFRALKIFRKRSCRLDDVAFPTSKVAMADSQQRHFGKRDLYYAYPEAQQSVLFWDGSVRVLKTGDANKGWNRREPLSSDPVSFTYQPDSAFESPVPAGRSDKVIGYYKWTRLGLKGIDIGGREISTTKAVGLY